VSFGYVPYGTLDINIFEDLSNNNEQEGDEELVDFVEVEVDIYKDGIFLKKRTITSGEDSLSLPPGNYQVVINDNNLVNLGYELTGASISINVIVPAGGTAIADYGYITEPTGAVSVEVYFDSNRNGAFEADSDDNLLENVRVILEADDGLLTMEGRTDSNGVVTFDNLPVLDTYKISIDEDTHEFNVPTQDNLPKGTFSVEANKTIQFNRGYRTGKLSNDGAGGDLAQAVVIPIGFPVF